MDNNIDDKLDLIIKNQSILNSKLDNIISSMMQSQSRENTAIFMQGITLADLFKIKKRGVIV